MTPCPVCHNPGPHVLKPDQFTYCLACCATWQERRRAAASAPVPVCSVRGCENPLPLLCVSHLIRSKASAPVEVERLVTALRPFATGTWGKVKAWIVAGAPTEEEGIAAARELTRLNAQVDDALAALRATSRAPVEVERALDELLSIVERGDRCTTEDDTRAKELEQRLRAALRATPVDEAAPGECCDLRDRLHLALLPGRRLNDDEIIDAVLALSDAKHACNCETPCEVHDRESATPPTCSCAAHKCDCAPLYCRDCADCCVEPSRRGRATPGATCTCGSPIDGMHDSGCPLGPSATPAGGEQAPPCDPEVFEKGVLVCIVGGVRTVQMEDWIGYARSHLAVTDKTTKLDWHFAGGRARVLALGNVEAATEACRDVFGVQILWTATPAHASKPAIGPFKDKYGEMVPLLCKNHGRAHCPACQPQGGRR